MGKSTIMAEAIVNRAMIERFILQEVITIGHI